MAYSTDNGPLLTHTQPIAGPRQWTYWSSHTALVAQSSTHITDGRDLGMKVGDKVDVYYITASATGHGLTSTAFNTLTSHVVVRVAATSINLSTGVVLASATG